MGDSCIPAGVGMRVVVDSLERVVGEEGKSMEDIDDLLDQTKLQIID